MIDTGTDRPRLITLVPTEEQEQWIDELDRVALTSAVAEHGLEAGDVGTVVAVHDGGRGYTVELLSPQGKTVAIVTLRSDAVRPREITHVRERA